MALFSKPGPQDKVRWRGVLLNRRTKDALVWAERKSGVKIRPTQGSWSTAVAASSTTHAAGAAVDLSVRGLNPPQLRSLLKALKDAGFAAWHRTAVAGLWSEHIHAIGILDPSASSSAKAQVKSYLDGRDGLKGNRVDSSYRPKPAVFWDPKKGAPAPIPKPASPKKGTAVKKVAKPATAKATK